MTAARQAVGGRLAAWAQSRPHVLMVVCPGATALRLEAESAVAASGGRCAQTPADADVLLVVGTPCRALCEAVDEVWAQMPGPRVRGQVTEPDSAQVVLTALVHRLTDRGQARGAAGRDETRTRQEPDGHPGEGDGAGASGMDMPGGLAMAERAEDRDGLKLDVLHVPLGPVLPYWPAGLVVETVLQGDVVQEAQGRLLPAAGPHRPSFWQPAGHPGSLSARLAARHLDSLGRLLAVAGWAGAADCARGLRDRLLGGEPQAQVRGSFARWRRGVERSRLLRWATDGLGVLDPERAAVLGVDGPAGRAAPPYDATARWRQWLAETDQLLAGGLVPDGGPRARPGSGVPPPRALLTAAVELMPGLDLAAARLLMASFDPDPDELAEREGTG